MYDPHGSPIMRLPLLPQGNGPSEIVGLEWFSGSDRMDEHAPPSLAIAFRSGVLQLQRSELDDRPIQKDTGMLLKLVKWNPQGTVLACAGVQQAYDGEISVVAFYSPHGVLYKTLRVPAQTVSSMAWDPDGLRMAIVVDAIPQLYFVSVRPDYKWGYFGTTLVYSFVKPERVEHCVMFWDTVTGVAIAKYVKRLTAIRAAGDHCVLATRAEEGRQFILVLCNAVGSPVDSKYTEVEPTFLAMTSTHVVAASATGVFVWHYRLEDHKGGAVETTMLSGAAGRSKAFHVDDKPTADSQRAATAQTQDPICCIAASSVSLFVGRKSGAVLRYELPSLASQGTIALGGPAATLSPNCDTTWLAAVDAEGVLITVNLATKQPTGFERTDVWDIRWSTDDPDLYVVLEKSKMFIFRGAEPEEPVQCSATVCEFKDLCIKCERLRERGQRSVSPRAMVSARYLTLLCQLAPPRTLRYDAFLSFRSPFSAANRAVHLDGIMQNPEAPSKDFVEVFEASPRKSQKNKHGTSPSSSLLSPLPGPCRSPSLLTCAAPCPILFHLRAAPFGTRASSSSASPQQTCTRSWTRAPTRGCGASWPRTASTSWSSWWRRRRS